MGQMASGIAHDFNNAVGIIMGNAEILLSFPEVIENPEEGSKVLNTIYLASKDAASIVRRLREFYKADEQEEEESVADLRQACKEAVALTEPRWKRQAQMEGRTITILNEFERAIVLMTPSKVRELLTNLIFNAVDALPEGGSITVSCGEEDGLGVLKVQDTGTGMTEEVRQKCLEMFFSTKGTKGTGLGLGMVNDMVRKHRGHIEVVSQEGRGTTFIVRLPLAESSTRIEAGEEVRLDRHLKILVVDDEEHYLSVMRRQLEGDGHEVVTAGDARDGLVRFLAGEFDLVITDHAMPAVNGAQLVRSIRRHDPDVRVIMQSGFVDAIKAEGGVPDGVDCLLQKPVQIAQLRRTVHELFEGARGGPG